MSIRVNGEFDAKPAQRSKLFRSILRLSRSLLLGCCRHHQKGVACGLKPQAESGSPFGAQDQMSKLQTQALVFGHRRPASFHEWWYSHEENQCSLVKKTRPPVKDAEGENVAIDCNAVAAYIVRHEVNRKQNPRSRHRSRTA
jgi:hypothetical protein